MQDYRKLVVWQRAHNFVLSVYTATSAFPNDEHLKEMDEIQRMLNALIRRINPNS